MVVLQRMRKAAAGPGERRSIERTYGDAIGQIMRIGAIFAFAYVALFIVGQLYLGSQPQAHYPAKGSLDQQARIFLTFTHQHGGVAVVAAVLAVLGYLLLIGAAFGLVPLLAIRKPRMARITLGVALGALVLNMVVIVVETVSFSGFAANYAAARGTADQLHWIHTLEDRLTVFRILELVAGELIAVWFVLVALGLFRAFGQRSIAAWGTVAACLLVGIGFPATMVLLAWAVGAGIGLLRLSRAGFAPPAAGDDGPIEGTVVDAGPLRPPGRVQGAHGSKNRRRRRR